MKKRTRKEVWIDISARAVVGALEAHERRKPGTCITKRKLMPFAVTRAESLWEEDDTMLFTLEAIPAPTEKWMFVNWPEICLYCARVLKKYIGWESGRGISGGIKLVSFEEWQQIPEKKLTPIAQGLVDNVEDRGRVTQEQGGTPYFLNIEVKQLTDGEQIANAMED